VGVAEGMFIFFLFFSYKSKYEKQTTLGHYHIVRTLLYETINQKGTGTFEEKMYFIIFFFQMILRLFIEKKEKK
jgi:hypothetical protein